MPGSEPISALVVEDDIDVRRAVTEGLTVNGFDVEAVGSAEAAVRTLKASKSDVVVLDVGLPGMSGIELCASLRAVGTAVPILILSARDAVGDRVAGLQAGADDYLVKPFDLNELVARLEALIRRSHSTEKAAPSPLEGTGSMLRIGELLIDEDRRSASTPDARLELTRKEFDLLAVFANNPQIVLSRIRLLELVWGYDFEVDTNVVDVFVSHLRKKMASVGLPKMIKTVRGVGFVMETD